MTAAKQAMLKHSQPKPVLWLCEQFHEEGRLEGRTILTVGELKALGVMHNAPKELNNKQVMAALKCEGFKPAPNRVRLNGAMRQLWISKPLLGQLSPDALKERYAAEKAKNRSAWHEDGEAATW
jgi:hypothetical protein